MKHWPCLVSACCTVLCALGIDALPSDAQSVVLEDETDVIVIMRDEIVAAPPGRGMHSARATAIESSPSPDLGGIRAGASQENPRIRHHQRLCGHCFEV